MKSQKYGEKVSKVYTDLYEFKSFLVLYNDICNYWTIPEFWNHNIIHS